MRTSSKKVTGLITYAPRLDDCFVSRSISGKMGIGMRGSDSGDSMNNFFRRARQNVVTAFLLHQSSLAFQEATYFFSRSATHDQKFFLIKTADSFFRFQIAIGVVVGTICLKEFMLPKTYSVGVA